MNNIRKKTEKMTQSDMGKVVGTSGDILGKYECDEIKPSIDTAAKIAIPNKVCGNSQVHLERSCRPLPAIVRFGSVLNPPISIFHALLVADQLAEGSNSFHARFLTSLLNERPPWNKVVRRKSPIKVKIVPKKN